MKILILIAITICLFVSCATFTPETSKDPRDPNWKEMSSFLGVNKDDVYFRVFAGKYQLKESTKGPSGAYYTEGHSAGMLYRRNVFSRIIVAPQQQEESLRPYSGKLPYGLLRTDTFESIKKKFGKPSYIQDESILIFKKRKLGFQFLNGRVSSITLDHE